MEQTPTGTILVKEPESDKSIVALYGRVSSADQKPDLDRQIARLTASVTQMGYLIGLVVTEIGSGLNGHRPKLMKLLANSEITTIAVEHRDRLMRFGCEYVESALAFTSAS